MSQTILSAKEDYRELDKYLKQQNINDLFVVCINGVEKLNIYEYLKRKEESENFNIVYFKKFAPNPTYESVCDGVNEFKKSNCKCILAIGGGSAMDVAKCIKLYSSMDKEKIYLEQDIVENDVLLIAVPTTAGTGSEATKFAVIYYNGEKQSIKDESCIPKVVLLDSSLLNTLPEYQRKATTLDAFSHSIESMWSINSTDESKKYAEQALDIIIENMDEYFNKNESANEKMLIAANLAGKAINISQTTAGHAMCYKLTSLYNISHGHAAALINSELFPYMIKHIEKCVDIRGKESLETTFKKITKLFKCENIEDGENYIRELLSKLDLYNVNINNDDIDILTKSVNLVRLKNNPIKLETEDIRNIYIKLFENIEKGK